MNLKLSVAILAIAAVPVYAQAQQSNTAKLKADAQNVVKIFSGDMAKTQTYCQITDLADQAEATMDEDKAVELSQKITALAGTLGPEYEALLRDLDDADIDPQSQDGQEITSTLVALEKLCEH